MSLDWAKGPDPNAEKVQGSEAWKKWRSKGLGSSDAPALLGWSPWKTCEQLYLEKRGLSKPVFSSYQERAMERGKRLEPIIRAWYEKKHGALFPDDATEHVAHPFMRASFDGINRDLKRIIEIKAPNANDHALAKEGFVPHKYIPQVQWLLMIAGLTHCDYVSYGSDDTYADIPVGADPIMQEELRIRAIHFWDAVTNQTPCPYVWEWKHPGHPVMLDL